MFKRRRMNRKKSKRVFRKGVMRVQKKNFGGKPMRGGIRL